MTVAVQGDRGASSEEAVLAASGEIPLRPCPTPAAASAALADPEAHATFVRVLGSYPRG